MKKIITAVIACAMVISSLCGCAYETQSAAQPAEHPVQLPEKYILSDLGLATPARDQKETGLCASYALINACESNLLVNGYESVDDLDLSEAHMYYYSFSSEDSRDSGADGNYTDMSGDFLGYGGYTVCLVNQLANGAGPVDESVVEFDPAKQDESLARLNAAHENGDMQKYMGEYLLTEADCLGNFTKEPVYEVYSVKKMKRSIFEKGAASIGVTTMGYLGNSDDGVTYFENIFTDDSLYKWIGHAVSIVGWDDNFSRENFKFMKPENDGAWLIKDSCKNKYGEYYYWLSYEQMFACFTTVDLSPRDEYGDILFYDSTMMCRSIKSEGEATVTANVFTVDKACSLKAVGVQTSAQEQPVIIEIYRNPDEYAPQSGRLAAKLETTIDRPGYHVVDLEKNVRLKAGDSFSILIRYPTDSLGIYDWQGRVPVEGEFTVVGDVDFGVDFVLTSQPGQSYVVYNNKWYDTSYPATAKLFGLDVTINNFGIKALMEKE